MLFTNEGHDHTTFGRFRLELLAHGGRPEQITEFCIDMSAAFLKGAERQFHEAGIVFNKFHVIKLVNNAVDEVRRVERKERPGLKRNRYLWLKNPSKLTKREEALLEALIPGKLRVVKTARAYRVKLALRARVSNGIVEAINSLVQAATAKGRGYRTTRNLITMVYLASGKLELPSPHLRYRGA